MNSVWRALDANLNRVAEGFRALEDVARFVCSDPELTRRLRRARHEIRACFSHFDRDLLTARDVATDPASGHVSTHSVQSRLGLRRLVSANAKRVQEGLRSVEECAKLLGEGERSRAMESLRFESYVLEQLLQGKLGRDLPAGIYGIITERFAGGRTVAEVALALARGGITVLQYREKHLQKSFRTMVTECRALRAITRDNGITFIVNDYPELAVLADADGIHVGQDDLSVTDLRRLVGSRLIGVSTHAPEQACGAVDDGADYLGVGPVFGTNIKDDVCAPVGLEYVEYAAANLAIPWVAIGGIKEHNMASVVACGATRVCLVSELIGADDITEKVRAVRAILEQGEEYHEYDAETGRHTRHRHASHAGGARC